MRARTGRARGRTARGGIFPVVRAFGGAALLAGALATGAVHAASVGGVEVEDGITAAGAPLTLAGAGIRTRFFIKLYVASLYLPDGMAASDAAAVIDADAPMAITLDVISDRVTRDRMVEALEEGFAASTGGDTAPVQDGIDAMLAAMEGGPVGDGESFTLAYEPGLGTRMLRGEDEVATIEGLDFKRALFGIWLSDAPVQGSLKQAMTGG